MTQKKSSSLPQTARFIVNVDRDLLKEIKKFAIDFEVDEREVPALAVRYLVNAYVAMSHQDRAKGLNYFFPCAEPCVGQDAPLAAVETVAETPGAE